MSTRAWLAVLWPSFLAACFLELLVFALVDPIDLHWGGDGAGMNRQGIYTLSFFAFWAVAACACALTLAFLLKPPIEELTRSPD